MRSSKEVARVQRLRALGLNASEIARQTGIPRSTVRGWLMGAVPHGDRGDQPVLDDLPAHAFTYLFGLYLGDGCLSRHARDVYKLRIALDSRYPRIIASCVASIRAVMPGNSTRVWKHPVHNVVEVGCYSKWWPLVFPQHGPGRKHHRPILIDPFQIRLIDPHVDQLLRGLIHSDGCRAINRVNGGYEYPRYQFSNRSADIRAIFSGACDELGIRWTQSNRWTISVSRRPDVARLDEFIGPKA